MNGTRARVGQRAPNTWSKVIHVHKGDTGHKGYIGQQVLDRKIKNSHRTARAVVAPPPKQPVNQLSPCGGTLMSLKHVARYDILLSFCINVLKVIQSIYDTYHALWLSIS